VGASDGDGNDRRSTCRVVSIRRAVNASTLTSFTTAAAAAVCIRAHNNGNVTSMRIFEYIKIKLDF